MKVIQHKLLFTTPWIASSFVSHLDTLNNTKYYLPTMAGDSSTNKDKSGTASAPTSNDNATNYLLVGSYFTIVALWGLSQVVYIPYVAHLLVLVTAILYAACHSSLLLREEPPKEDPNKDPSMHSYPSTVSSDRETLRKEDAYQFPIIGSISLFGLYLAFKYLDKDLVNLLIGAYFAVVGCLALTVSVDPLVTRVVFSSPEKNKWIHFGRKIPHSLPTWLAGDSPLDLTVEFSISQVFSIIIAAVVCGFYLQSKPWYLNNVLGISFCLQGIERFSLGTYKIGAILLIGLFFYDIFWVRGVNVFTFVEMGIVHHFHKLFSIFCTGIWNRGNGDSGQKLGRPDQDFVSTRITHSQPRNG